MGRGRKEMRKEQGEGGGEDSVRGLKTRVNDGTDVVSGRYPGTEDL